MQARVALLALVLALGTAGLAPTAAAADADQRESYVSAGGHLAAEYPPDPGTVVEADRALGAATCEPTAVPLPPLPVDPPAPPAPPEPPAPSLGGACFDVVGYPDDALITVQVTRATVTVPENVLTFAAGYDLDGDGCVGCTPADALWRGNGALTIPVPDGATSLAVFVYSASADSDPIGPEGLVSVVTAGEITVDRVGSSDVTCVQEPGAEDRCGLPLETPRPHLCLPGCVGVVTPQ